MRTAAVLAVLALGAWLAPLGADQSDPPKDKEGAAPLDAEFVKAIAASNMARNVIGRFGTTRSTSVEVKRFAQRIVADHVKPRADLIALAVKKKIQLPPAVDQKDREATQKLLANQGREFDRGSWNSW